MSRLDMASLAGSVVRWPLRVVDRRSVRAHTIETPSVSGYPVRFGLRPSAVHQVEAQAFRDRCSSGRSSCGGQCEARRRGRPSRGCAIGEVVP